MYGVQSSRSFLVGHRPGHVNSRIEYNLIEFIRKRHIFDQVLSSGLLPSVRVTLARPEQKDKNKKEK